MRIIFEASTLLSDWFVQFPVDWGCEKMPQKGDMIIALQLLPDNKDLLSFFREKVVERSRKQNPIRINSEGYSYAYQDAAYDGKIKGNPYDDPHILKRGCYVVESLIWGMIDDEIGIIVSLNEL